MDYKEKYEHALERAKNLHKDAIDMGEYIRAKLCEIIFPELKESEDEKIRKALIRFHKSTIDVDGIKGEDIIAWLEKQGEPIDDNIIARDDEILQAISVGLTDVVEDLGWSDFGGLPIEEIQEWLEKQGDQKLTSQKAQDLIEKYVSDHADCRWLDASELEQLLNDFVLEYDVIKNREYEQQCKCKSE